MGARQSDQRDASARSGVLQRQNRVSAREGWAKPMRWVNGLRRKLRFLSEEAGEGWAIFAAVWICGAALFLLTFLNLRTLDQQGFIPVQLSAAQLADYSVDDRGHQFRPMSLDLIRVAMADQAGGTQSAEQRLDRVMTELQAPIPSTAPMAMAPSDASAKPTKRDGPETGSQENTSRPTKTPRPSHTPRPTHTPHNVQSPTNTVGPSHGSSDTPAPQPTSIPGPAATKKPSKTPKPTKTPKN